MMRNAGWWVVLASVGMLAGCVERRYVITSDPPGAVVLENGKPIGVTPVDGSFVYYGNYHYTLQREGFETLQVDEPIKTPWYEIAPLDFFTENLLPWNIKDVRRFHYPLKPLQAVRSDQVLERAQQLRERGEAVGTPGANGKHLAPPGRLPPKPPPEAPVPTPQLGQPLQP